jgi:hypothetical protein
MNQALYAHMNNKRKMKKKKKQNKFGRTAQVAERLPSKNKAWNSSPSTTKEKKRRKIQYTQG